MTKHCVEHIYVKGLENEIGMEGQHLLTIHKTNFENWKLEFSVFEEQQLNFFKEAKLNEEQIEVSIYIQYMNRLTGKAMIKNIENNEIVVEGTSTLNGYRYIYNRGKFVTTF
ncbi:transposase [Bacillus pseudomycoides]|uniref:transposase n=1 Tax=Bacillus pseudomycoides TaxID=64104 RepID=UPI000BF1DEF9|nr:transposase [Bacillus pseudomycoides]PEM69350.1 transposase [Bacillus pseudomycoides]